ncbi:MAG TPA: hypothetical protein VES02_00705 [Dermatophilaceae bacterium]|nr:hypothetical protein [Dermatophilaceae bacterium]
MLGIAIGQVWTDIATTLTLTHLPSETPITVGGGARPVLRVVS